MRIPIATGFLMWFLLGCTTVSDLPQSQQVVTKQQIEQAKQNFKLPLPLVFAEKRVTKKPFGIKISPQNSPVQPERFSGYHTGTDFETFPDEQDKVIAIAAICDGKILQERSVSGYGGVVVESCQLNNQAVTVLYGHLKLASVSQQVGDALKAGENFAVLGAAYSTETGGERKHLHLGIHRGTGVDVRGYVQNKSELNDWPDFETLLR